MRLDSLRVDGAILTRNRKLERMKFGEGKAYN